MHAQDRLINFLGHGFSPSRVVLHDQRPVLLARAQVREPPVEKGLGPGRWGLATAPLLLQALQLPVDGLVGAVVRLAIADDADPGDEVGSNSFVKVRSASTVDDGVVLVGAVEMPKDQVSSK